MDYGHNNSIITDSIQYRGQSGTALRGFCKLGAI